MNNFPVRKILLIGFMFIPSLIVVGQEKIRIGINAEPVISWFGPDIDAVKNVGARSGFSFGIAFERPFSPNYSFSTGLNLSGAGGRLSAEETTIFELGDHKDKLVTVEPDEAVVYKIQYLSIPLGLKLKTNQIGYMTFFTDVGLDPKVVVGGKLDIQSQDISDEKAPGEIRFFNAGYHIKAGIEYGIGGNTAFVLGLGFENNFLDITEENGDQPDDKVSHRILSFRFGILF